MEYLRMKIRYEQFLRLCTYYIRFVPNFASVAVSVHELTKKSKVYQWGESQEWCQEICYWWCTFPSDRWDRDSHTLLKSHTGKAWTVVLCDPTWATSSAGVYKMLSYVPVWPIISVKDWAFRTEMTAAIIEPWRTVSTLHWAPPDFRLQHWTSKRHKT